MPTEIQPEQLRTRLAAGEDLFLLDVREPDEVAEYAIPGAVNIPLGELGSRSAEIPTTRPVVTICAAGVRSAQAAEALERAGWSVQNLAGGTIAWQATDASG